jgi:hypothetical protein
MTEWATINVHVLTVNCCSNIFSKALQILPTWPSVPTEYTTVYLLKLYLSNALSDISELVLLFGLSSEDILLIGTKILLNTN